MPRWNDPLLRGGLVGVDSCEHCRTVTWAGIAACSCGFGVAAVDESAVRAMVAPSVEGDAESVSPLIDDMS